MGVKNKVEKYFENKKLEMEVLKKQEKYFEDIENFNGDYIIRNEKDGIKKEILKTPLGFVVKKTDFSKNTSVDGKVIYDTEYQLYDKDKESFYCVRKSEIEPEGSVFAGDSFKENQANREFLSGGVISDNEKIIFSQEYSKGSPLDLNSIELLNGYNLCKNAFDNKLNEMNNVKELD